MDEALGAVDRTGGARVGTAAAKSERPTGKAMDAGAEADAAGRAAASNGGSAASGVAPAAPTEAGTIRDANPTGGKRNCVNCAVATDSILRGAPASALPGGPFRISVLERHFGGKFKPATLQNIEATLQSEGSGATGIVFAYRPGQSVGHVFNAVNQGGTIRFLDGQIGGAANTSYWTHFQFMPIKPIGK